MKPINVIAKKVKNGYLIPNSPELDILQGSEIIVEIISEKIDPVPEKNFKTKKEKTTRKKNPADEKSYKELAAEAAVERCEKKQKIRCLQS